MSVTRLNRLGKMIKFNSTNKCAVAYITEQMIWWNYPDTYGKTKRSVRRMLRRAKSPNSPNQHLRP